jgi:asparagine synthase (glutamine-hydrolysing)
MSIAGHVGGSGEKVRDALARRGPGTFTVETAAPATLIAPRVLTRGTRRVAVTGTADVTPVLERGAEGLADLTGSFALALWDSGTLVLARDRFGEKPLAYTIARGELWFGPDAGVLRAAGAPVGGLDRTALSDYLELLCVPAPRSIWSGVRKLPAGHALTFRDEKWEIGSYAPRLVPGASGAPVNRSLVLETLREVARDARPQTLVLAASTSWAPLAALLPGHRTVAVGYAADDPAIHAVPAAEPVILTGTTLVKALEATASSPEPSGDASQVAVEAALAAAGAVRVAVPHGGAPVFADAARYRTAALVPHSTRVGRIASMLQKVAPGRHAARLSRAARALGSTGGDRVRALAEAFTPEDRKALLHSEARKLPLPGTHPERNLDAALAFDLDVLLPERFLPALDRAAARAGADVVAPFLDRRVAELVVPARSREKLRGDGLLRSLLAAGPDGRSTPPIRSWLTGPLRTQLDDLVRPPSAKIRTFMDPRGIDSILTRSLQPNGDPRQAYALLMLELWARAR